MTVLDRVTIRWLILDRKMALRMWRGRWRRTTNKKKREFYARKIERVRTELAELVLSQ